MLAILKQLQQREALKPPTPRATTTAGPDGPPRAAPRGPSAAGPPPHRILTSTRGPEPPPARSSASSFAWKVSLERKGSPSRCSLQLANHHGQRSAAQLSTPRPRGTRRPPGNFAQLGGNGALQPDLTAPHAAAASTRALSHVSEERHKRAPDQRHAVLERSFRRRSTEPPRNCRVLSSEPPVITQRRPPLLPIFYLARQDDRE